MVVELLHINDFSADYIAEILAERLNIDRARGAAVSDMSKDIEAVISAFENAINIRIRIIENEEE